MGWSSAARSCSIPPQAGVLSRPARCPPHAPSTPPRSFARRSFERLVSVEAVGVGLRDHKPFLLARHVNDQLARYYDERRMRDHPEMRPHAHPLHLPMPQHRLEAFNLAEIAARLQRLARVL